jgi:superfamily II DNA or RNA helicase
MYAIANSDNSVLASDSFNVKLRPYQREIYDSLLNHQNVPVVVQMPTGVGKGTVIVKTVFDALETNKSCLILVPSVELLDNLYERILLYNPDFSRFVGLLGTGRCKPGKERINQLKKPVVIAVYKTLYLLLQKETLPHFDIVISDECHHAVAPQWKHLLNHYSKSWNIGFTATPRRLDGRPLSLIYQKIISSKPLAWFIEHGYLCEYLLRTHKTDLAISPFSDDLADQQRYFDRQTIIGDAIREWETYALGKKTLIFCTGISHAVHTANEFNTYFRGKYQFAYLGSDLTAKQRQQIIEDYKRGKYTGIVNVAIVTEGVDIPDIVCVSLLRFTASLPLWLQMVGRALRPKPSGERAILLDHAGNALIHGSPDMDHEWSIEPDPDNPISSNNKICCPNCQLPVISYKKLATYGESGIDLRCPHCGCLHHYQHVPQERRPRADIPVIDTSKDLEEYRIDPIMFKIVKILRSARLRQNKIKTILELKCDRSYKIAALDSLGLSAEAIETYLGLD